MDIASKARKVINTELEKVTIERALTGADLYLNDTLRSLFVQELLCHWDKYYGDANNNANTTLMSTCADTGFCPIQYQKSEYKYVDITNITENYYTTCVNPSSILIHHTVTPTVEDTISILQQNGLSVQYIVERNGTIFKMVNEWRGAWHAGAGNWRDMKSLNLRSVGIENVNDGHSPFTQAQITSLIYLVKTLKTRWYVKDYNILGHHDYGPHRKDDPSGYFPWAALYAGLDIYPGLFTSNITLTEQTNVLISNCSYDEGTMNRVQEGLQRYGYTTLSMTPGKLDDNMLFNMESFNRHFCPEIFIKEAFNETSQTNIRNPINQRWYGISDERLAYLLRTI